jgi:hypothetical protein
MTGAQRNRGRVQRGLAALYDRSGSRIAIVCLIGGYVGGGSDMAVTLAGGARYRIGALGGELRIDSAPGRGTTVTGTIPIGAR